MNGFEHYKFEHSSVPNVGTSLSNMHLLAAKTCNFGANHNTFRGALPTGLLEMFRCSRLNEAARSSGGPPRSRMEPHSTSGAEPLHALEQSHSAVGSPPRGWRPQRSTTRDPRALRLESPCSGSLARHIAIWACWPSAEALPLVGALACYRSHPGRLHVATSTTGSRTFERALEQGVVETQLRMDQTSGAPLDAGEGPSGLAGSTSSLVGLQSHVPELGTLAHTDHQVRPTAVVSR